MRIFSSLRRPLGGFMPPQEAAVEVRDEGVAETLRHVEILGRLILRTLHRLEKNMDYTTQQILDAVTAERTQIASVSAMIGGLKERLNAALSGQISPQAQATLNAIMAEVQGNSTALSDAINSVPDSAATGSATDGKAPPPSPPPSKSATSTTVSLSKSQVAPGDSVTITAGVSSADGNPKAITGTVTFATDGGNIGSASVDSTGVASMSAPVPAGDHSITATYGGDDNYASSTSAAVTLSAVAPAAPADTTAGASTTQTVASQPGA